MRWMLLAVLLTGCGVSDSQIKEQAATVERLRLDRNAARQAYHGAKGRDEKAEAWKSYVAIQDEHIAQEMKLEGLQQRKEQ